MPKNTATKRRTDAHLLARFAGTTYSSALRALDGDGDHVHAAAIVDMVELTVRARRSLLGEARGIAVDRVLRGAAEVLPDDVFPVVDEPDTRWHLLTGVVVTLHRHARDFSQCAAGLVLGAQWGPSGTVLRVVLTVPVLDLPVGDVVAFTMSRWRATPAPADVIATASRSTHCAAGRPLYTQQRSRSPTESS